MVGINREYLDKIRQAGLNPEQYINKLIDQHFFPWKYAKYENELIDRQIEELKPSPGELEIIHRYLTYQILRDFKQRMFTRYDHSVPTFTLDYYIKELSVAVIERNFDQDEIEQTYAYTIKEIKRRDPDFNLRTFIDNIMRLRFMSTKIARVIKKFDNLDMKRR